MKKYFLLGLIIAIAPNVCFGAGARYTQLVREKQRKMEELEKCMGSTKGLKIAGLSTLGLTAVGVAGNVVEAKKIDEYESGIKSKEKELEKLDKDIAEKQAEIKKAEEAEAAAAAAQKKAEEEAIEAYKTTCSTTGGTINENGICICSDQKPSNDNGSCTRIEVVSVQSSVAGSELTGVVAPNNNLLTWNPVATNDGQNSTVSGSGSTFLVDNNENLSTDKTETATAFNGGNSVKTEEKTSKTTEQSSTTVKETKAQDKKQETKTTSKSSTVQPEESKSSDTYMKSSDSQTGTSKTTTTSTSTATTSKTDPCASLRNSGKFKSVTTLSDGRCSVDCGYGKYFDAVHKTCESQYDVPGNTQRSSKGVISAPAGSNSNSGKSTKSNTQPQRTNKQIIDEAVEKSNKQDNLYKGDEVCWQKVNSYDGIDGVALMLDGTCQIKCKQSYAFNTTSKRCEKGIFGTQTGYLK